MPTSAPTVSPPILSGDEKVEEPPDDEVLPLPPPPTTGARGIGIEGKALTGALDGVFVDVE